jgi:hypothetical protein
MKLDEANPDAPAPGAESDPSPKVDDYGYAPAEPQPGDAPIENVQVTDPKGTLDPKEEPSPTGYGDAPKEEVKPEEEAKGETGYEEKPPEVKVEIIQKPGIAPEGEDATKIELELDVGDLPEESVKQIREFAKTHSVTKEVAQALIDSRKETFKRRADAEVQAENDRKALRVSYHKELKEDKEFGGENFAHNIKQAGKVLTEFFPGMKKALTDRGSMLPPYIMKDLSKLAKHLYSTNTVVHGDPVVDKKKESDEQSSPLDFYNQKTS